MASSSSSDMTAVCQRARPEILAMAGYASARSLQLPGSETVFLDANECAFEPFVGANGLSRYPAQQPAQLVDAFCRWLDVSSRNLTITRGADEAIDCLMRAFCIPAIDNVVICPPTFAMYEQSAMLQGVAVRSAMLDSDFGLDLAAIEKVVDANTKMIFVCSPNNPTANIMDAGAIQKLCETYADTALIVVDETYIEFSDQPSSIAKLDQFANLVVLRTLSKSHAAAGLRCGAAVARGDVTSLLQKVLAPYPLAAPVMQAALTILKPENTAKLAEKRADIVTRRNGYTKDFVKLDDVQSVLPSDANYLLLLVRDAAELCAKVRKSGIILRDQSHQPGLENAVRIAIGSAEEMQQLLAVMAGKNYLRYQRNAALASRARPVKPPFQLPSISIKQRRLKSIQVLAFMIICWIRLPNMVVFRLSLNVMAICTLIRIIRLRIAPLRLGRPFAARLAPSAALAAMGFFCQWMNHWFRLHLILVAGFTLISRLISPKAMLATCHAIWCHMCFIRLPNICRPIFTSR